MFAKKVLTFVETKAIMFESLQSSSVFTNQLVNIKIRENKKGIYHIWHLDYDAKKCEKNMHVLN